MKVCADVQTAWEDAKRAALLGPTLPDEADEVDPLIAAGDSLAAALRAAEEALAAIAVNAESWHADEEGLRRAMNVIATWARDPSSVPEGIRAALAAASTEGADDVPGV